MNYHKIHNDIINKAKSRNNLQGYTEKHHICPTSIGGSNHPDNIVELTAREHYIIHKLLVYMYPDVLSFKYALWAMTGLFREGRHYVSGREYEWVKKQMSEATKIRLEKNNPWLGREQIERILNEKKNISRLYHELNQVDMQMETQFTEYIDYLNETMATILNIDYKYFHE